MNKLAYSERKKNYVVSEPSFHTAKSFIEKLSAIEMKKTKIFMNKRVYLGFSILELSKTLIYEFWYDHVRS